MNNAAQIDDLWDPSYPIDGPLPYLESNQILDRVLAPPVSRPSRKEMTEFEFLGERIQGVHENGVGFPKELLERLISLMQISDLEAGWNSYGGQPLNNSVIRPVLQMLFAAQGRCQLPNLVPLSDGGVGMRWSVPGHDLEIDVAEHGIEGAFYDLENGAETELPVGANVDDAVQLFEQFCGKI